MKRSSFLQRRLGRRFLAEVALHLDGKSARHEVAGDFVARRPEFAGDGGQKDPLSPASTIARAYRSIPRFLVVTRIPCDRKHCAAWRRRA